uniref:Uncharacterized protein n=1 Tax=Phaeomonas parva TaxID=124430 RepID=A0A7S1U589_9STRA|mmetsp:Transcript_31761/g.100934  ORF Transcript_31761/g.100934 Transcript_31761/m.100934 type:complete len:190 (+) Transcript_31761:581-1150(+)
MAKAMRRRARGRRASYRGYGIAASKSGRVQLESQLITPPHTHTPHTPQMRGAMSFDKKRLASLGTSLTLSYGAVSNYNMSVMMGLAWYTFSMKYGISPLAPGQWKGFLAVYAGFYVLSNVLRPLRIVVATAMAPKLDEFVKGLQGKFGMTKPMAFFIAVFLLNILGTCVAFGSCILTASIASGVPIWAR